MINLDTPETICKAIKLQFYCENIHVEATPFFKLDNTLEWNKSGSFP